MEKLRFSTQASRNPTPHRLLNAGLYKLLELIR